MASMFKSAHADSSASVPEISHINPSFGVIPSDPALRNTAAKEQAFIGKDLVFHGEITGNESLVIDGRMEGAVSLPGNRVTVSRNGQVNANISAREIVIMGKVRGDVSATDRVDVRAEGSLTGDVTAARISIEDGAFFKGGIDIRKAEGRPIRSVGPIEQEPEQELQQA